MDEQRKDMGKVVVVPGFNGPRPMLASEAAALARTRSNASVASSTGRRSIDEGSRRGGPSGGRPSGANTPPFESQHGGGNFGRSSKQDGTNSLPDKALIPNGTALPPPLNSHLSGGSNKQRLGTPGARTNDLTAASAKGGKDKRGMSLYWLEQHVRTNKLKFVTLTGQLASADEQPDGAINEVGINQSDD